MNGGECGGLYKTLYTSSCMCVLMTMNRAKSRETLMKERIVETYDGVYEWRRNAGGQLYLRRTNA